MCLMFYMYLLSLILQKVSLKLKPICPCCDEQVENLPDCGDFKFIMFNVFLNVSSIHKNLSYLSFLHDK